MATSFNPISDFKQFLVDNHLVITPSKGDGHCLIYSVISSLKGQLNKSTTPEEVKSQIYVESINNITHYLPFIKDASRGRFSTYLRQYILYKRYNNQYGDIAPLVIANALGVTIKIIDEEGGSSTSVSPRKPSTHSIYVHRTNDHYNGMTNNSPSEDGLRSVEVHRLQPRLMDLHGTMPALNTEESKLEQNELKEKCTSDTTIKYSSDQLRKFSSQHFRIKREVRKTIFSLKLWKPKSPSGSCQRPFDTNSGVHHNILQSIPRGDMDLAEEPSTTNNVNFLLMNVQSIKNKDIAIRKLIEERKSDFAVITETWLSDEDDIWKMGSELNNNGLSLKTSDRKGRKGGGIALVHSDKIKVKESDKGAKNSFEFAAWKIQCGNIPTSVIAVYRPPYSEQNRSSIPSFCDEFSDFISEAIAEHSNLILLGDFNIHINNDNDKNAMLFTERTETLGLTQHVNGATQKSGNTLDLIFTEGTSVFNVIKCQNLEYISDHCVIACELDIKKEPVKRTKINYRKYKDINLEDFKKEIEFDHSNFNDSDELAKCFEETSRKAIDKLAPEKTKIATIRRKNTWFTEEIRQQKSKVRQKERLWRKT